MHLRKLTLLFAVPCMSCWLLHVENSGIYSIFSLRTHSKSCVAGYRVPFTNYFIKVCLSIAAWIFDWLIWFPGCGLIDQSSERNLNLASKFGSTWLQSLDQILFKIILRTRTLLYPVMEVISNPALSQIDADVPFSLVILMNFLDPFVFLFVRSKVKWTSSTDY